MSLRNTASKLAYWTIPPGIANIIRKSLIPPSHTPANLLSEEERIILARNEKFRNRHRGERCFILATGPSIKQQDLKLLQGETCIAVSNFFVHPDYELIKPAYYCIAPYHLPITEAAWRDWMTALNDQTSDTSFFFGISDQGRNSQIFSERDVHYLKFAGCWDQYVYEYPDLTHAIPGPQSVSIMALSLALFMGFSNIFLLGCDHDWILHIDESRHFYKEQEHQLVRSGYNEWFGQDYESYCSDYISLWRQYKAIKCLANHQAMNIVNATHGGLLDVFPRVDFDSLMLKTGKNAG